MSVKLDDKSQQVVLTLNQSSRLFLRFFLDEVDRQANPLTPKDTGRLRQSPLKVVSGNTGKIEWRKEYAAAQEAGTTRGYPIVNYTTPGTGPHYARIGVQRAVQNAATILSKARLI